MRNFSGVTFEFDPDKSASNRSKHGLSLADAQSLWSVPGIEFEVATVQGEFRYARLAIRSGVVHIAIFTFRGAAVRLISARVATPQETRRYEQSRKK